MGFLCISFDFYSTSSHFGCVWMNKLCIVYRPKRENKNRLNIWSAVSLPHNVKIYSNWRLLIPIAMCAPRCEFTRLLDGMLFCLFDVLLRNQFVTANCFAQNWTIITFILCLIADGKRFRWNLSFNWNQIFIWVCTMNRKIRRATIHPSKTPKKDIVNNWIVWNSIVAMFVYSIEWRPIFLVCAAVVAMGIHSSSWYFHLTIRPSKKQCFWRAASQPIHTLSNPLRVTLDSVKQPVPLLLLAVAVAGCLLGSAI